MTSARGGATESIPMNLTLRGPALVDDTVLPDVLVQRRGRAHRRGHPSHPGRRRCDVPDAGAERVSGTMLPAYVDIHCHGGGGTAFTDLDDKAAARAAEHHHAHGSTSLLASLVTMTPRDLERGVAMLAEIADDGLVDGIHLEGPWLAEARCGAHDPTLLRDPTLAEVERLLAARARAHPPGDARAGARPRARPRALAHRGRRCTRPSVTRRRPSRRSSRPWQLAPTSRRTSSTAWTRGTTACRAPFRHCCARPPAGHVTVELIADGVHLSDDTVRTVLDLVGAGSSPSSPTRWPPRASVTAPTCSAGCPSSSTAASRAWPATPAPRPRAPSPGARATSPTSSRGPVASGVPLAYAARPGTRTPARALGLADRGVLAVGARADVLVVDDAASVTRVMRRGVWLR